MNQAAASLFEKQCFMAKLVPIYVAPSLLGIYFEHVNDKWQSPHVQEYSDVNHIQRTWEREKGNKNTLVKVLFVCFNVAHKVTARCTHFILPEQKSLFENVNII